ncbi:MAG TPA: hypothetical protein VF992_09115 [Thermoplasmata archaeon]
MLDVLAAVLLTAWVLVLLWQVMRGAVSPKVVSRLSGNPKLIAGYFRVAQILVFAAIGLGIVVAFLLILVLENFPGVGVLWGVAALSIGAYLLSRRLAQTALAAESAGAPRQSQTK